MSECFNKFYSMNASAKEINLQILLAWSKKAQVPTIVQLVCAEDVQNLKLIIVLYV